MKRGMRYGIKSRTARSLFEMLAAATALGLNVSPARSRRSARTNITHAEKFLATTTTPIASNSVKIHSRCRAIVSHMYVTRSRVHNMVQLMVCQRRRHPYNTKSNKARIVKTPGGELRYLHIKKKASPVKCTHFSASISIHRVLIKNYRW